MKVLIVLSHLMDKHGKLGPESLARANKAIDVCNHRDCGLLITSGWAYRDDVSLAISDVMSSYIGEKINNKNCTICSDSNARDTVGDAFFARRRLVQTDLEELIVVTSDYHVNRAKIIFDSFFSAFTTIEVIGAPTAKTKDDKTLSHEESSILAFKNTFKNTGLSNDNEVIKTLTLSHPFYNGEYYPIFNYPKPLHDL